MDITDPDLIVKMKDKIEAEIGVVDILMNNAAILNKPHWMVNDNKNVSKLIDVNVKGLFWVSFTKAV